MNSVAIIGLGLIGGSIARDLAARGVRVVAEDCDEGAVERAIAAGAVAGRAGDLRDVDIIVIAVPVGAAPSVLRRVADRAESARLVIDAGSTKASIVAAAAALPLADRFVGCHPLTGNHASGFDASRCGMFEGARVFACPTPSTSDAAIRRAERFWEELGAVVERIDAERHDELVAAASHLPQIASTALANTIGASGLASGDLGRGGREMTRLAGSSAALWTHICLDNAEAIGDALRLYRDALAHFASALERRDAEAMKELFESGRRWKEH